MKKMYLFGVYYLYRQLHALRHGPPEEVALVR